METISITNRGSIRKFVDDVFIDTIENIYALFDLKISYYGVSIAYKNTCLLYTSPSPRDS